MENLPVYWASNKKAWMLSSLYQEWFEKYFVPQVKGYCERKKIPFKILLLVDNCKAHPDLSGINPSVTCMYQIYILQKLSTPTNSCSCFVKALDIIHTLHCPCNSHCQFRLISVQSRVQYTLLYLLSLNHKIKSHKSKKAHKYHHSISASWT